MANLTLVTPNSPVKLTTVEDGKVKGGNTSITVAYPSSYNVTSFVLETEDDGGLLTYATGALREAGPYNYGSYKAWDFRGYWEDNYTSNERTASITFIPQPTSLGLGPVTLEIYQDGYQGPSATLTVDTSSISSPSAASTYAVNLSVADATSGTTYTSSSSDSSWLTCRTNGNWNNGTRAHTISVTQNNTSGPRSGSITFTAYEGSFPVSTVKVSVTQSAATQGDIIFAPSTPGSASVAWNETRSFAYITASNLNAGNYTFSHTFGGIITSVSDAPLSATNPNDRRYNSVIYFPTNSQGQEAYGWVDYQMSSSTDVVTKRFWVTQSANPNIPEYAASINLNPGQADANGAGDTITVRVTYAGNMAQQTILEPVDQYNDGLTFTSTSVAGYDSAVTKSFDYTITVPQNSTGQTRYPSVDFRMRSSSQEITLETFDITQETPVSGYMDVNPFMPDVTYDTTQILFHVTCSNVDEGNYTIEEPVSYTVTSIALQGTPSKVGNLTYLDYLVTFPANNTTSNVYRSVEFRMSSSLGRKTATAYITQGPGPETPTYAASVNVNPSSDTVSANGGTKTTRVTYAGNMSQQTILAPTSNISGVTFSSASVVDTDVTKSFDYSVNLPANQAYTSRNFFVSFSMRSSSYATTKAGYTVVQSGQNEPDPGSITINPSNELNVNADSVQSIFYVTYSNQIASGYTVESPVTSSISSIASSSTNDGVSSYYTYTLTYPKNGSTTSAITRTAQFRMSGSLGRVTATGTIVQAKSSAQVEGSVDVNPVTQTVEYNVTQSILFVTYSNQVAGNYTVLEPVNYNLTSIEYRGQSFANNNLYVQYMLTFPVNESTQNTRNGSAQFRMSSSLGTKTATAYIYQNPKPASTYVASVAVSPSTIYPVVGGETKTVKVDYAGNMAQQTIQQPSCSLAGVTFTSTSLSSTAETKSFNYQVTVPANSSQNSRTFYVSFSMVSSSAQTIRTKGSLGVIQAGQGTPAPSSGSITIGPYNPSNVEAALTQSTFQVTYVNQLASNYTVLSPILSSNLVLKESSSTDNGVSSTWTYVFTYPKNSSTTDQVTRTAQFRMTGSLGLVTGTGTIIQNKAANIPVYSISSSWTDLETGSKAITTYVDVKYTGGTVPASFVSTPTFTGNILSVTSQSVGVGSDSVTLRYTLNIKANAQALPTSSAITFSTHGLGAVSKTIFVHQEGTEPVQGNISFMPPQGYVRVSSWATSNMFYTSYSGVNPWTVQPVSPSSGVTVSSSSRDGGTGVKIYTYNLTYPANGGTSPVTRSVGVYLSSGSSMVSKTFYIYQDAGSSGTTKHISVSPSSVNIDADTVQASCTAYYYGISSAESVTTPSTNASGWSANVGNVSEQDGLVIINWEFRGTANTGTSQKTINFTLGASGMSSQTFTIYQSGIGGGGSITTNTVPVWQQNIISAGDVGSLLTVTSGSKTLFSDWVYARPGVSQATVDLNRICESFVVSDPIGSDQGGTGLVSLAEASHAIPSFDAVFSSGPRFTSKILKDWSYSLPAKTGLLSDISQVKAAGGQYIVFTYLNAGSSTTSGTLTRPNGSRSFSVAGGTYQDVVEAASCGTYSAGGKVWNVTSNAKWVCYFRNKYNGLESLVLEGPVVPSVTVTRNNYLQGVYNYTKSYLNKVVDGWKCSTGIVPDNQTALVSMLVESPEVILHDIANGKLYRTKAVTNSIEKKTFRNQGRNFATYEFNLESILTQARR